jgi:hypothetical protein
MPPFAVDEELQAGSLVSLLRNYRTPEFSIAAVYPHRQHLAAKVRVFINALAKLSAGRDWLNPDVAAPPPRDAVNLTDIYAAPSSSSLRRQPASKRASVVEQAGASRFASVAASR